MQEPWPSDRVPHVCLECDEVLAAWIQLARPSRPWSTMYADDVSGELRHVLEILLTATPSLDPRERRRRLRRAGRDHGAFRRGQRCPSNALADELTIIEASIVGVLLFHGMPRPAARRWLGGLSPELKSVRRAFYSGYVDGR
jgi:hypothetical protein